MVGFISNNSAVSQCGTYSAMKDVEAKKVVVIFSRSKATYHCGVGLLLACLLACGEIDNLHKKLTPGGSVLGLMIILSLYDTSDEVLKDTFARN